MNEKQQQQQHQAQLRFVISVKFALPERQRGRKGERERKWQREIGRLTITHTPHWTSDLFGSDKLISIANPSKNDALPRMIQHFRWLFTHHSSVYSQALSLDSDRCQQQVNWITSKELFVYHFRICWSIAQLPICRYRKISMRLITH